MLCTQGDAHITGIREDSIHPDLLGVDKLVSEDAARRALMRIDESAGLAWLSRHLAKTTQPLLDTPWILDLDTTIKSLYGKQEGGEDAESCAQRGVLGPVAGALATLQAAEALKVLAGIPTPLTRDLWVFDDKTMESRRIRRHRDPHCPVCKASP